MHHSSFSDSDRRSSPGADGWPLQSFAGPHASAKATRRWRPAWARASKQRGGDDVVRPTATSTARPRRRRRATVRGERSKAREPPDRSGSWLGDRRRSRSPPLAAAAIMGGSAARDEKGRGPSVTEEPRQVLDRGRPAQQVAKASDLVLCRAMRT